MSLKHQLLETWAYLVPDARDRIPIDRNNFWSFVLPAFSTFGLMCLLARRPHTRLYRLALIPPTLFYVSRLAFVVQWLPPHWLPGNVGLTAGSIFTLVRTLEFGLSPNGIERVGETSVAEGHLSKDNSWFDTIYWAIHDGLDVGCSVRGVGWKYGVQSGVRVPPDQRPVNNRKEWLRQTFNSVAIRYLLMDFGTPLSQWFQPELKTQIGYPIWPEHLHPVLKYVHGTIFTAVACVIAVNYISIWYDAASLVAVGILGREPTSWPPLFGQPWFAKSLHDFWGFQWHQMVRHNLQLVLGNPLGRLFGNSGLVFGSFFASGIFHSMVLNGDGVPGICWTTVGMFTVQSLGLFLERGFRKVTGKRVGGIWGNIWTALWICILTQPTENIWIGRQHMGVPMIPKSLSLAHLTGALFNRFVRYTR